MKIAGLDPIRGGIDPKILVADIQDGHTFRLNTADSQLMETNKDDAGKQTAMWKVVPTEITIDGRAVWVPGVDINEYEKRKTILFNHNDNIQVGSMLWIKRTETSKPYIYMKGTFAPTDFAQETFEMVDKGFYNMVSPGLWPVESYFFSEAMIEYEKDYEKKPKELYYYGRKTKLYEVSIAPVAAWAGAQKMALLNYGMSDAMKNALTFDIVKCYIESVEQLKAQLSALGLPATLPGDVSVTAETSGASDSAKSGDAVNVQQMMLDVKHAFTEFTHEKSQTKRRSG